MLALATIAYNKPRAIEEQIRLFEKHLLDRHELIVIDNSDDPYRYMVEHACRNRVRYVRSPSLKHEHHEALDYAAKMLLASDATHIGFLDHDVFPSKPTQLLPLIEKAGFYGIGQRHMPTGFEYLWPGFCFFSRVWLAGRVPNFGGIRNGNKADDGDTGSNLHELFNESDWRKLHHAPHGYQELRPIDEHGLQSWGIEWFGDWVHLTNTSQWKDVPSPQERERLAFDVIAKL